MFQSRTRPLFAATLRRFKSGLPVSVDEFPYKRLSRKHVNRMVSQLDSTRLPLRSFFAQHMPLMPFAKPAARETDEERTQWVEVPAQTLHSARPGFGQHAHHTAPHVVPEAVARHLGPFDRRALLRDGRSPQREARPDVQSVMQKLPALMEYLQQHHMHADGEIHIIPLSLNKLDEIDATSVLRKRRLKMNKHKYKKRIKKQRLKRRGEEK